MIRNIRIDNMKLKNKNYKQSNSVSINEIKLNSKKAFQKHIQSNSEYDNYINSIYQRMVQEQKESPILIIPKKFESFINSKLFRQLLRKIFEYMMMLEQFQLKYRQHCAEYKVKSGTLMIHESNELQQKCKEISYVYMGILLSYGESKFIFKDQYFFQTMIYFISQILKENFQEQIYSVIDSQLNRIFRTNTFNLIKRRYQEDQVVNRYPQLKDAKYVSTPKGDQRLIKRLNVHKKFRYAVEIPIEEPQSVTRPLNISQSASKSIHSRSPLIATFFPGSLEKLFTFSRQNSMRDNIISFRGSRGSLSSRK